uniref:Uncharacterized protein n=1 Tax=Oryza punctata TaxID=4537 RepID=A0A0E0M018_ORYPU
MDAAIKEVMAEDMHSTNATATEQAVVEDGTEAEANTILGLATKVLEMVAEAKALEATAEGDVSGDPEAMTPEEASPEKHVPNFKEHS